MSGRVGLAGMAPSPSAINSHIIARFGDPILIFLLLPLRHLLPGRANKPVACPFLERTCLRFGFGLSGPFGARVTGPTKRPASTPPVRAIAVGTRPTHQLGAAQRSHVDVGRQPLGHASFRNAQPTILQPFKFF